MHNAQDSVQKSQAYKHTAESDTQNKIKLIGNIWPVEPHTIQRKINLYKHQSLHCTSISPSLQIVY